MLFVHNLEMDLRSSERGPDTKALSLEKLQLGRWERAGIATLGHSAATGPGNGAPRKSQDHREPVQGLP